MSKYNTKNYTEQGGERTVIGGELDIVGDGQILKDGEPVDLGGGGGDPVNWDDVQGKPSTFPPSTHTHTIADIDTLQATLNDIESRLAALESAGD